MPDLFDEPDLSKPLNVLAGLQPASVNYPRLCAERISALHPVQVNAAMNEVEPWARALVTSLVVIHIGKRIADVRSLQERQDMIAVLPDYMVFRVRQEVSKYFSARKVRR